MLVPGVCIALQLMLCLFCLHMTCTWCFADSAEALMAGRKPPMQLLVRVVGTEDHVISNIQPLLSEAFVVRLGTPGRSVLNNGRFCRLLRLCMQDCSDAAAVQYV